LDVGLAGLGEWCSDADENFETGSLASYATENLKLI